MDLKNIEVSAIKNIPPITGEYAYYDSRLNPNDNTSIDLDTWYHWLVTCGNDSTVGCNYSLPYIKPDEPFITCHGKITKVFHHQHETHCTPKDIRA